MKHTICLPFVAVLALSLGVFSQTPTPEPAEKVLTEEIRLNVSVTGDAVGRALELSKEDLVILEDGRLHQASSVRPLPASVLIAMDTGGSMRQKKNLETTRSTASAVAGELRDGTHLAVLNFHDRTERLIGWTLDKQETLSTIAKKAGMGRRSMFTQAMSEAETILRAAPTDNRHLVLITDGADSIGDDGARSAAIRRLWESGVVVHVISYTAMESEAQRPFGGLLQKGEPNPRRVPEEVMEALAYALPVRKIEAREILRQIYQPRLLSIIIDMPYLRAQRKQAKALAMAELQMSVLSEYTGGEFVVPETLAEMTEKAAGVSRAINSQQVVTYVPKRSLAEVKADEIRTIEVSSRRPGVEVRARRKLVIFGPAETK